MAGSIQWENVNLAGAFIIGTIFGTLGTLRVLRAVAQVFARRAASPPTDASSAHQSGEDGPTG